MLHRGLTVARSLREVPRRRIECLWFSKPKTDSRMTEPRVDIARFERTDTRLGLMPDA